MNENNNQAAIISSLSTALLLNDKKSGNIFQNNLFTNYAPTALNNSAQNIFNYELNNNINLEQNDGDDEEEREILSRLKLAERFSQSAHENLAQIMVNECLMADGKCKKITKKDLINSQDEDSDEEFYVHKALLPLKKSKSLTAGILQLNQSHLSFENNEKSNNFNTFVAQQSTNNKIKLVENSSTPIQFELVMQESVLESDNFENLNIFSINKSNVNNGDGIKSRQMSSSENTDDETMFSISSSIELNIDCWSAPAAPSDYDSDPNESNQEENSNNNDFDNQNDLTIHKKSDPNDNFFSEKKNLLYELFNNDNNSNKKSQKKEQQYKNIVFNETKNNLKKNELFGAQINSYNSWSSPCIFEKNENKHLTKRLRHKNNKQIKTEIIYNQTPTKLNKIDSLCDVNLLPKINQKNKEINKNSNNEINNQLINLKNDQNNTQSQYDENNIFINKFPTNDLSKSLKIVLNERKSIFQKDKFNKFYDVITKLETEQFNNNNFNSNNDKMTEIDYLEDKSAINVLSDDSNLSSAQNENNSVVNINLEMRQPNISEIFTSIDIPMADDPLFMSTSSIFLKNDAKNFNIAVDPYKLTKQNCSQRRSPPFASEDELSESELSELELRVARGDFASTPNDFNYKKSICSSRSSTISCDSKNELNEFDFKQSLNELNSTPVKELHKSIEEQFIFQELIKQNHLQNKNNYKLNKSENTNRLMWLHGTVNEFTSMPCLAFTQQQQQIDLPTLFVDSNNSNNCFMNKNNKINDNSKRYVVGSSNFVDFCDNTDFKTKKMMTRSFTTGVQYNKHLFSNNFCLSNQQKQQQQQYLFLKPARRVLPLRPDELNKAEDFETYIRQPYQQRIFSPLHSVPISTIHSQNVYQLQQPCQSIIQKQSRRLPQIPQSATTSITTKTTTTTTTNLNCFDGNANYLPNNQINKNYENDCKTIKSQRLLEFMNSETLVHSTPKQQFISTSNSFDEYSQNCYDTASLLQYLPSTSLNTNPSTDLMTPQKRPFREDYQLYYGMDASLINSSEQGLLQKSNYENSIKLKNNDNNNRVKSYGLMEDSYYEDGISSGGSYMNNFPISNNNSKNSSYNLTDGENSSGISSCCTSASTVAENVTNVNEIISDNNKNINHYPLLLQNKKLEDDNCRPTHRVQFSFVPRHNDEILLEVGDAIHVERIDSDHWCYGTNLRTGQNGIFPTAHICKIDLVYEICQEALINTNNIPNIQKKEQDTFYLTLLASIEVAHHKGNDVLVQAINKVCLMYQQKDEVLVPQTVLVEISFRGVHVIDKRKKDFFRCPTFDFFYSLQNISFCGAHPEQLRYFGFITKHPLLPRFACHVFLSQESTQPIVEAIGRAFKRSYDEYMAFAHPTEDIFIE